MSVTAVIYSVEDNSDNVSQNAPRNAPAAQMITGDFIVVHKAKEEAAAPSSNRLTNGATDAGKVSCGLKAYPTRRPATSP